MRWRDFKLLCLHKYLIWFGRNLYICNDKGKEIKKTILFHYNGNNVVRMRYSPKELTKKEWKGVKK